MIKTDRNLASDTISDFARQVQGVILTSPMVVPQMDNLLQAQETVLQDVEAFSYHWFDRRRTATRTALKAVQHVAKTGGRDSGWNDGRQWGHCGSPVRATPQSRQRSRCSCTAGFYFSGMTNKSSTWISGLLF
ncbi:hypothetical protein [Roseovarius marisflavi]|uniref:hypothetical protein n=1 Tax=Roseovarius marisflavi TaxID=1054996 RepID=UPI0011149D61|nr:hypothetical protein [Roseovarius marisflavi]